MKLIFEEPFGERNPKGEVFSYHVNFLLLIVKCDLLYTFEPLDIGLLLSFVGTEKVERRKSKSCLGIRCVKLTLAIV